MGGWVLSPLVASHSGYIQRANYKGDHKHKQVQKDTMEVESKYKGKEVMLVEHNCRA